MDSRVLVILVLIAAFGVWKIASLIENAVWHHRMNQWRRNRGL